MLSIVCRVEFIICVLLNFGSFIFLFACTVQFYMCNLYFHESWRDITSIISIIIIIFLIIIINEQTDWISCTCWTDDWSGEPESSSLKLGDNIDEVIEYLNHIWKKHLGWVLHTNRKWGTVKIIFQIQWMLLKRKGRHVKSGKIIWNSNIT